MHGKCGTVFLPLPHLCKKSFCLLFVPPDQFPVSILRHDTEERSYSVFRKKDVKAEKLFLIHAGNNVIHPDSDFHILTV